MTAKGVSPVVAAVLLMAIAIASVSAAAVFVGDTMQGLQNGVEDWLMSEDRKESSEISIDYAYNSSGYLIADVRNTGSVTLAVEKNDEKNWNLYVDGIPQDWSYMSGSSYASQSLVQVDPTSVITINTTEPFPAAGNSVEIEFTGPYETRTTYVCFSENGACES